MRGEWGGRGTGEGCVGEEVRGEWEEREQVRGV